MDIFNIPWNWTEMCGPSGFQPWNDTTNDFGLCFQKLCFNLPIYFIIAIVSAYYIGFKKDWVIREKTQERAIVLRSFIVLALVFIPIVEMYVFVTDPNFVMRPIDYLVDGTSCLCWLVHFGYILALKHRLGHSSRGPTVLLVCWSSAFVLSIINLRSGLLGKTEVASDIAVLCCHVLYLLTLIPSSDSRPTFYRACLVGSQHNHSEYTPLLPHMDDEVLGTAMQGSGFFSKLFFAWMEPIFTKGSQEKLTDIEELFDVPLSCSCGYVGAKIDRALIGNVDHYQQFQEIPHEPFIATGYGATGETVSQSTPVTPTSRVLVRPSRRQNVTLLRALHSCFALQFYSIGVLKFIADAAGFAGPLLLNSLITFVQDVTIDAHYGYLYAGGLIGATLLSTILNAQFNWLMSLVGLKLRAAIVSTVMRKTLSVTSSQLEVSFSVGEITNFMSTDADRIVNACPSFHALWSIPLQLFVTLFLLYKQVGISFLAGVAFSVVLIPINKLIANKIGQLSTELMKHKDSRVSLVADMLRGIRTIKMHVWEDYFIDRVSECRTQELKYLRGRKYLDAICVVLWAVTPVLVAALTITAHALRGATLDAPTVFTTVALVNMLISPLNAFPWVLNGMTEAWVSIKRIQKFLEMPEMDPETYYDRLNTNRNEDDIIILKNATFAWATPSYKKKVTKSKKQKGKSKRKTKGSTQRRGSNSSIDTMVQGEPFELKDLNLRIGREEFIGVAGNIGSGKTSLLLAIIGDMIKKNGSIEIPENLDSFGYVSQKAWLIRGTIRDNILFGKPYEEAKFKSVIDACALTEDLNVLGWNASIGEGGCTLSGGQRMRVALARAVYQDKQVYLLDDILSCVDVQVGQHILNHCILGLLKHKARILVTHSSNALARAHTAVLISDGRIVTKGPPDTVLPDIEDYLPSDAEFGEEPSRVEPKIDGDEDNVSRNSLDEEESMSQGSVSWWVISLYLKSVGSVLTVAIILSLILMQLSQNMTFLWLAYWVKNRSKNSTTLELTPSPENTTLLDHGFNAVDNLVHSILRKVGFGNNVTEMVTELPVLGVQSTVVYDDKFYLEMYFGLAAVNLAFTIMRAFLFAYGGVLAANKLHKMLLKSIIRAKVKFFDTTPTGRILNRFSSDTYTVDDSLPFIMNILMAQIFGLMGAIGVTVYALPWVLVCIVPLLPIYLHLQRKYRRTSRSLKRLQSRALTPVYSHFNDTLAGISTIRALATSPRCQEWLSTHVERWQRASLAAAAAAQWLAVRLQAVAVAVLAGAVVMCAVQRDLRTLDAGLVGLAITYALSMTSMLTGVMNAFTETEREMIAVERVGEYIREVESEKVGGAPPPYGWPSQGVLSFENVSLKYSGRSRSTALSAVSFSCRPSEKVGVVGRTGAGKSSLVAAVVRVTPVSTGRICVDGVDLATLDLRALRSRIGVIPQEPFLFSGSVSCNVDPLGTHQAEAIWAALGKAGAAPALASRGGLLADVKSLPRSLAQLVAVARAILHKPKILLIDEATANLDQETERTILDTIKTSFAGSTVLFVAHRIIGAIECDRVMVLKRGQIQEFASPDVLLDDPTSHLYKMVHALDE